MRDISRTRIARRGFGVLATALLALLGLGAIPAAAEPPESGLVGRWDVTVTIHITEPPEHAYLYCTLSAEHLVSCDSKPGQPPLHGQGVWNKTEGNTFAFWITHHAFLDANGNPTGSIYAEHIGHFSRRHFTTNGFTYIDMHDGTPWAGPVTVESVADRVG